MTHDPSIADLPAALRLQLRGLRADAPPARDLWPDIAARLAATPQSTPEADAPRDRGRHLAWQGFAAAAVLALAVGLGWQLRPSAEPATATAASPLAASPPASPLIIEADALTREYRGALREIGTVRPATAGYATLLELDASAAEVHDALEQDPDAVFLLQRLQHIYTQRLSLTQRLARA